MIERENQIKELQTLMFEKSNSVNAEPIFTDSEGNEHHLDEKATKVINDILEQAYLPFLAEVVIDNGYCKMHDMLTQFENMFRERCKTQLKALCWEYGDGACDVMAIFDETLKELKNERY